MILEKQNVMKTAQNKWSTKIVPAILQYGDSRSKGKAATTAREARAEFEGMYVLKFDICLLQAPYLVHIGCTCIIKLVRYTHTYIYM